METLESDIRHFNLKPPKHMGFQQDLAGDVTYVARTVGFDTLPMCLDEKNNSAAERTNMPYPMGPIGEWIRPSSISNLDARQSMHLNQGSWNSLGHGGIHYVRALYDYTSLSISELNLHRGDIIQVLNMDESGWCDGVTRDVRGWFPINYCTGAIDLRELAVDLDNSEKTNTLHDIAVVKSDPPDSEVATCEVDTEMVSELRSSPTKESEEESLAAIENGSGVPEEDIYAAGSQRNITDEQKSDTEFWSESELSFVGIHLDSGSRSPTGVLSPSSQSIALDLASRILWQYVEQQQQHEGKGKNHASHRQNSGAVSCQNAEKSETSSGPSSADSSPSQTSGSSKTWTIISPSLDKRKLRKINEDSDEEEEENEEGHRKHKRARDDKIKLFACPFAKFDSDRYSERNVAEREYRSCSSCLLRDIPRLKQHLYRVHKRPEHYCPSCFEAFKTRTLLDGHVRSRSCRLREPLYEEKMTVDQMKEIKRRNRGGTAYEHWFGIFKILFPDAPLPVSPYAGEDEATRSAVQHFVNFFRAYGPENLLDLIRDRRGIVPTLDASTQEIVDEAFEITAPSLLRQLQTNGLAAAEDFPSEGQGRILAAAKSAVESISSRMRNENATADVQDQSRRPSETWDELTMWSTIDQSTELATHQNAMDIFDFDAVFDPLAVDDAFASYHS